MLETMVLLKVLLFFILYYMGHYFGDFLFQMPLGNMAVEKKTNTRVALAHILIYTTCFIPVCAVFLPWQLTICALLLIGLFHFLQDRFNWPLTWYMTKIKTLGTWEPSLYIEIDNGWHKFSNLVILTVFIWVSIL
jgi:hypothetical protein